ncbi:MAG: ABC transporter permease [Phycisphaeraceae bacterium]|nr:ABC transporter permease [Phycisphaeraceae bacterium]
MIRKMLDVALREFSATVLTKGFLLGVFLPPILMIGAVMLIPALMNQTPPRTQGRIAVIDRSGSVVDGIRAELSPERMSATREERRHQARELVTKNAPGVVPEEQMDRALDQAMRQAAADGPSLSVETLFADADSESAKAEIPTTRRRSDLTDKDPRLAVVVVPEGAVTKPQGRDGPAEFEPFEIYSAPTLDIEVKGIIQGAVERSIVNARIAAAGLDAREVRALTATPRSNAVTVTQTGERKTSEIASMLVPGAFMLLLWISVFTAGQSLLTSTIEEKGSRVMEVLLSAVSPLELMTGKILGQMGVGLLILSIYGGVGVISLVALAMADLIDPMNLVYLAFYFLIAYFIIACLMAAVGSAVSDLREAQSLMGPVMIVLVIPMMLWMPIMRNPNSMFAQVCSFIPPISPFVMVLRLGGSEPVPFWQIPASIALGIATVGVALWATAKIFRIGVLMYGKPPSFGTLISWVRMA